MCALGVWRGLAEGLFLAADRSQKWQGRPGNVSRDTQQHFTPAVWWFVSDAVTHGRVMTAKRKPTDTQWKIAAPPTSPATRNRCR